MIIMSNKR